MHFVSFWKVLTGTVVRRGLLALTLAPLLWAIDAGMRPDMPAQAVAAVVRDAALVPEGERKPAFGDHWKVVARGDIPIYQQDKAAHASSLLMSDKGLLVFWFSGDRESGPHVQITASQWDAASQQWSAPKVVVNRHQMGQALGFGLRRLGNPVAWRDGQGRIHLFVVATGLGGWAASRVLHVRQCATSSDALATMCFEPVGILPLGWGLNISHLVRNAPMPLADGGMVLPVHFELGHKASALLRFDAQGSYLGMVRISQRTYALQPTLLALGERHWLALMRDERSHGHILVSETENGGQSWRDLPDLGLPNPDSAVAALTLAPGHHLLAHNESQAGRDRLDLRYSTDGRQWKLLQILEQGKPEDEFSYPSMVWTGDSLWVSYTVDRARLAWQRLEPVRQARK